MVCARCEMAVRSLFDEMIISVLSIKLGEVELSKTLENLEKKQLSEHYERDYFLVLDENKPIFKDIESLKLELKSIQEKIKNKHLELKKIPLSSIKEKYIK